MRRLAPLAFWVMVVTAGCFGGAAPMENSAPDSPEPWRQGKTPGEPSKKIYTQILRQQFYVPSKDGTRLAAALYKPVVPDGVKLPIILIITPYEVLVTSQPTQVDPGVVPDGSPSYENELAPRGYAVVTANVRGTGNSDGCYDNRGLREREDGYALVEYFAAQPWSNGRVGMAGGSYLGSTQWTTAASNPPHLVTVMPSSATISVYRHLHVNGVKTGEGGNFASYYAIGAAPGLDVARPGWAEGRVADLRCPHAEIVSSDLDASGDYTPFWAERDVEKDAANITASVFLTHGFSDTTVRAFMTVPGYERLTSPKRAYLGQWGHANPGTPPATKESWYELTTRWFDYWLKDIDTGVMDEPAVRVQDSTGTWNDYDAWPPVSGTAARYYLSRTGNGPGELRSDPPSAPEASSRFMAALSPTAATAQGQPYEVRFVSEALPAALHLSGTPQLSLTGATSANERSYWKATLYDVSGSNWREVVVGYINLRHRDGVASPQPIEPGRAYTFQFPLAPHDFVFAAGHRIGLVISGPGDSAWPDTGEPFNTLYHDAQRPSYLTLPVAPAAPVAGGS